VIALALLGLATSCGAQRGVLTSHRDLAQLTDSAATIVHGRIILARVEPHPLYPHLSTVVVIMRADEILKGAPEPTFTFRQFIFDIRDRHDAAGYRKGDEYLLLMNPPNHLGLTSPVGLEQGRFRVFRNPDGKPVAINGRSNRGLFQATASKPRFETMPKRLAAIAAQHQGGPVALDDLRSMIRQLSLRP
jgi:hypothetical protein